MGYLRHYRRAGTLGDQLETTNNVPEAALCLVGINDLISGRNVDQVITDMRRVVGALTDKGCRSIILVSLPPCPRFRLSDQTQKDIISVNASSQLLEGFNDAVKFVDFHRKCFDDDGNIKEHYFEDKHRKGTPDRIHLSEKEMSRLQAFIVADEQ